GRNRRLTALLSYLFLFYSLLIAYTPASGPVFSAILEALCSINIAPAMASLFFTLLVCYILFLGTRTVDLFNRVLMIGLIISYLGMIGFGLAKIDPELLSHSAPRLTLLSIPVLVVSFGFQNMIPSLTSYLNNNLKKVRLTIIGGGLISLCIYLIWSILVLGVVAPEEIQMSYARGEEATVPLRAALGSQAITHFAQGFAFFAIVTSFLAQGLT